MTSVASVIVLVGGLLITGGTITGGAPAAAMLVGVIILGATGILAMTFVLLARANNPRVVGASAGFLNVILFFPERRRLSDRELSAVAAHLCPLQSRDPRGERAQIDPVQGRELRRDLERPRVSCVVFTALMLVIASMTVKRTL